MCIRDSAWRDWGINIVWTFGYIVMNVVMSEFLKPLEGGGDLLLYKRGHMPELGSESVDTKVASREEMMASLNGPDVDLAKIIESKDVFTWNHLNYTIPYDGATRQLLSDVFGYVKPCLLYTSTTRDTSDHIVTDVGSISVS